MNRLKSLLKDQIQDKNKLETFEYSNMGWQDWYNLFRDEKIQWRNKTKNEENIEWFKTHKSKITKMVIPVHKIKSKSRVSCRKSNELNEEIQIDHSIKPVILNPSNLNKLRGSGLLPLKAAKQTLNRRKLTKVSLVDNYDL